MKRNIETYLKIRSLFVMTALAGSATLCQAQLTNNPNTFDTASSTTSEVVWWGPPNPVITWDATLDAANNPSSGSVRFEEAFTGASEEQFMTQSTLGNQKQWDDSILIDGTKYTNFSFDIKVDPSTAPSIAGDYGPLEVGLLTKAADWGTILLGNYTIPLSATNWTHVVLPIDPTAANIDKVVGTFFKMWSNGRFTNTLIFNLDNVYIEPGAFPPPPPPTLTLEKSKPGLNLISSSPGQYDRQSIYTLDPNYSWVNATGPVSYSVTIKDYPGNNYPNFQTHIFLAPQASIPYGPGDSAVDWNSTNLVFVQIQNHADGTASATFMYKTNVTSSTDRWDGQIFGSNRLATVQSTNIRGNWSVTFNNNTNVQMTSPDGSVTNFTFPAASADLFAGPLYAWVGAQANTSANIGQSAVLGRVHISGGVSPEIDDNFATGPLDNTKWGLSAADSTGIQVVTPETPFWLNWTLPDVGYTLQMTPQLNPATWTDAGLTTLKVGSHRSVLLPNTISPTNSAFFRLVKRVFVKLQVVMPGETAAPDTPSGKTGTPIPQQVGTPFDVIVNACDENWHVVNSTDTIHLTSTDASATLPADAQLVGGAKTFSVTFNASGSFTITASDVTDATKTSGTSSPTNVQ